MGAVSSRQLLYLFLWISFLGLFSAPVFGQQLSGLEQSQVDKIAEGCALDSLQSAAVLQIYLKANLALAQLDKERKQIEQSDAYTEEEINTRVAVIFQQKKDLKEYREYDVLEQLTAEQRVLYKTKFVQEKPKVLHFGIHNRADCNVCNK